MAQNEIIKEALSKTTDRRRLLKRLATAGAAVGAAVTTGGLQAQSPPAGPSAADVIQFALNLEYLEAEFYSVATTGQTLAMRGVPISGTGTAGATTAATTNAIGNFVNFSNNVFSGRQPAVNIAADEVAHVILLRTALMNNGVTPVAKPAINLDALAALGASLSNQNSFLYLARIFEDIGVSAYGGGAALLAGSPYLTTAARILAVEGEHAGNIRLQIASLGIPTMPIDAVDIVPPPSSNAVTAGTTAANPYLSSASQVSTANGFYNFFSTNPANGLSAIRTPGQVLYLAYGVGLGAGTSAGGGFFPNGVNGAINTASSAATASGLALV
ncbi:MAG: ferritin-like domain-containing protein [Acidobacteriota bacterium]|nr:ferritin-like domain-containing protein [Acidobacteriota bacterium]